MRCIYLLCQRLHLSAVYGRNTCTVEAICFCRSLEPEVMPGLGFQQDQGSTAVFSFTPRFLSGDRLICGTLQSCIAVVFWL